jgi:hypothetical protein
MGEVHDLADQRPHLAVYTEDAAHIIPHALIHDIITGKQPSSVLTESVIRRVLEEWLEMVT